MATKKDQSEFTSTLLTNNGPSVKRDRLIEIYKQDRQKARIIFENGSKEDYAEDSTWVFEYNNKDFRVVSFTKNISFSKNNIMYRRDKTNHIFMYKHETKSFYLKINGVFKPLTVGLLNAYANWKIKEYFIGKFGWLRNTFDVSSCYNLTLTTINKKKLFNKEKLIKHTYGVNHNVAKVLDIAITENQNIKFLWKQYKHLFINLDKLTPEFFKNHLIYDTCRFAQSFGEKINCAWGKKRIKQLHDTLYKKHIDVILEFEPLLLLSNRTVYLDFAKFSGYKILLTNHDLIAEGKKQSHCVGTYGPQVNNGTSAIFSINKYTLEIRYGVQWNVANVNPNKVLFIGQFRGYGNCDAPKKLYDEVNAYLGEFNKDINKYEEIFKKESMTSFYEELVNPLNDLPF
jgi:hypothetical protein